MKINHGILPNFQNTMVVSKYSHNFKYIWYTIYDISTTTRISKVVLQFLQLIVFIFYNKHTCAIVKGKIRQLIRWKQENSDDPEFNLVEWASRVTIHLVGAGNLNHQYSNDQLEKKN